MFSRKKLRILNFLFFTSLIFPGNRAVMRQKLKNAC